MTPVLRTQSLAVRYGGVDALRAVDIEVGRGELVGLIGPNGAGKTTLIDATTGFVHCTGSIELDGSDVTTMSPHLRARRGLARTWQSAELFDDLNVRENLGVATGPVRLGRMIREIVAGRTEKQSGVDGTLKLLGLSDVADSRPTEIGQGLRKLVGVARALVSEPRVLLLDEPAAGLDTDESRELGRHLRSVVGAGTSMLLVDHDMGLVLSVCDRVYVLEFGTVIATGTPAEIRTDPRVIEAYLGHAGADPATEPTAVDRRRQEV